MKQAIPIILVLCGLIFSCEEKKNATDEITTPWGDTLNTNGQLVGDTSTILSLEDLVRNGELIMLTESGPKTYYEYHGCYLGAQYLLIQSLAEKLGVRVRVDICKDSADIIARLKNHEGDIAAFQTVGSFKAENAELQNLLKKHITTSLISQVSSRESTIVASGGVKRKVYSPYRNLSGGIISEYDNYFKQYSQQTGWDWRLIAAQCYQESCFDPNAVSYAGAKGLMQIMPKTAAHLGLAPDEVYDPERSISAACKLIVELSSAFKDVPDSYERQNFVLASYNGGAGHVRDAMALAKADGKDQYLWDNIKEYILKLSTPEGYKNPLVRHGYIRGTETVGYVDNIRRRYTTYGGSNSISGRTYSRPMPEESSIRYYAPTATPQRANTHSKH